MGVRFSGNGVQHRMNQYFEKRRPAGVRALRLATAAFVTIWAASAATLGDDNPPKAANGGAAAANQQPAAAKGQTPTSQRVLIPRIQPLQQQGTTPASKQSGCSDKGSPTVPTPSDGGPQPRWVCKEQTVTADPVWAGEKAEFVFEIGNEGEADLQIKLKGG